MSDSASIGSVGAPMRVTGAEAPSLEKAAEEFEALLLNMMIKSMRASVPRSDVFGESKHVETYEQLLDQEYAQAMARRGGFGFARLLVEQFGGDEAAGMRSLRAATSRLREADESYRAHSAAADIETTGDKR